MVKVIGSNPGYLLKSVLLYLCTYLSNIKIDSKKSIAMIDVFDSLNIGLEKNEL